MTPPTAERQVLSALGSISAATLTSRILGFVRDMVVARAFGAGPVTDAFFVAFRVPNMLRRLLAEGALATAVVPVFTDFTVNRSGDEFTRMLRAVLGTGVVVLTATTVLGIVFAPWIVHVIAPGFATDPEQAALTIYLTRVMFPYLLLVGVSALAMGVLNTRGRFFGSALGPALSNVGMIFAVVALASRVEPPILSLAIGVLIGGVAQLAVQVPSLRACGGLVAPSAEFRHPALTRVVRLLLPSVFGLAAVQVTVFVNTLLASLLPAGSISFLYYADRVMEFPLGVFGIALASASLPAMSRQAAAGDTAGVAATLNFALRLSTFITVPATAGLVVLRTPIVRVLFERGEFSSADTVATAQALAWYAAGLAGFAGARIAAQTFYALAQPGTAVRLGIASVVVNVVAALVLMHPLKHGGLALASSIGAYVNLLGLMWVARRRFGPLGGRALLTSGVRTVAASLPLLAWCAAALVVWPVGFGRWVDAACLAAVIVVGGGVFWLASGVFAAPERAALGGILPRGRRLL